MAFTTNQTLVAEIAQATYGRALANTGLDFYANHLTAGTMTEASIMAEFMSNAEGAARYPAVADNAATVTQIFTNVLGRSPAQSGIDHYAALLAAGTMTKTQLVSQVLADAKGAAGDSTYISAQVTTADATYSGAAAGSDAASDAAAVKNDATAINLTAGADIIQGTTGNDTINAFVGTNSVNGNNVDTITSIDIIDGGAGTDTLTVQHSSAAVNGATIANVENIVYTAFVNNGFSMANTTGVSSFTNKGSIVAMNVTAIASVMDVTVQNINAQNTVLTYNASAVTGLADTQKVTLNNASNGAVVDLNDAAIETLAITTAGAASNVTFDDIGANVTKVTVDGDQNLTLAFLDTTATAEVITSFDASAATGNVTANLVTGLSASNMAVKTGSGDDKITQTNLTSLDSFDMGAGSDTLVLTVNASVTTAMTMTGVETLAVDSTLDTTINLSGATDLTTISVFGVDAGTDDMTFTQAAASVQNLNFDSSTGSLVNQSLDRVVFGLKSATGTSDVLNINFQNTNAQGLHVKKTAGQIVTVDAITANGIETMTLTTADLGADSSITSTPAVDGGVNITALNADRLTKLTITSDTLVDLNDTATNLNTYVNTVDASLATGGVHLDLATAVDAGQTTAASKFLKVDTGSGNDVLTNFNGATAVSTINLGAGNDSITMAADMGTAGNAGVESLVLDAGAGNDTIDLSADTSVASVATKTITTGTGVDTVKIAGLATQTGITITDFTAGSGGDKLDLLTNDSDVAGGTVLTSFQSFATGAAWAADTAAIAAAGANDEFNNGFITLGTNIATADEAGLVTALGGAEIFGEGTGGAVTDIAYILADDGSNSYLFHVTNSDAASLKVLATADVAVLVATFTGIADATTFTVDNLTDFLA